MPTLTFDTTPSGLFASYAESQFTLTTQQATDLHLTNVLWNGDLKAPQGTGGYLINEYSQDTVVLNYSGTTTFGALAIDVNGYRNAGFDANNSVIPGSSTVSFNFTGVRADYTEVRFTFTTDAVDGFQHVVLPTDFATGLTALTWTTTNPVEAWGAFDNVSLVVDTTQAPPPVVPPTPGPNHAPVAVADTAAVAVHGAVVINVLGNDTDADGDTLGIAGFGPSVSAIGAGLSAKSALGATVSFQSGQLLYTANAASFDTVAAGHSVTDTFYYRVTDPAGATSTATVTVTVSAPPPPPPPPPPVFGPDINGTKRSEVLTGTSASEHIYGRGGSDTLNGNDGNDTLFATDGGNDKLLGGAGNDMLWAGAGKDTLDGGTGADTLSGGAGNDLFVFGSSFGKDIVLDFRGGTFGGDEDNHNDRQGDDNNQGNHQNDGHGQSNQAWQAGDVLKISPSMFSSYADVIAHAKQTLLGVVITTTDGANSITLIGTSLSSLHSQDFLFG
ncbi:MAG: hypothetical protein JWQ46_2438 [Phenylobacterium sp.]|nr:hypothetical protein [Phenylobacterium sp.]